MRTMFIPNWRAVALFCFLCMLLFGVLPALAQETPPEPLPPPFEVLTNEAGAYLTSLSVLALALQTALTLFAGAFEQLKRTLTNEHAYLIVYFIVRGVVAWFSLTTFWGGVEAMRSIAPTLLAFAPDVGVLLASTLLIVLGEEVIRPLIQLVYALKDFIRKLSEQTPAAPQVR